MVKVAFFKGQRSGWKGFWDRVVRIVSRGPYSHCELIFDPLPQLWVSAIAAEGVHANYHGDPDPAEWDLITIDCDVAAVMKFIARELGSDYDWLGVARFVFPWLRQSRSRWFCSEFCAAALQTGGRIWGATPHALSPVGLYRMLQQVTYDDAHHKELK